jgi:hypothetical protein
MGGGAHPPHPKWVWSPAGGWQWQDVWAPVCFCCSDSCLFPPPRERALHSRLPHPDAQAPPCVPSAGSDAALTAAVGWRSASQRPCAIISVGRILSGFVILFPCSGCFGSQPPCPGLRLSARSVLQGIQGAYNKNWQRNTGLAVLAGGMAIAYIFNLSRRLEQRYAVSALV